MAQRVPRGDNRPRLVCDHCGFIHYQNPKVVAGCIPEWYGKVLLCRRAIEPRSGYWTIPAGYMENGESAGQAAVRETQEEANAVVDGLTLYGLYNLVTINQVYLIFRGQLRDASARAGDESLAVELFAEDHIPWGDLAFPVVADVLRRYYRERRQGQFAVQSADVLPADHQRPVFHYY